MPSIRKAGAKFTQSALVALCKEGKIVGVKVAVVSQQVKCDTLQVIFADRALLLKSKKSRS